jgi:hypothetical protein
MATNAHPSVAYLHNTHYILPERRQKRMFFCFLLGEKPKMATNAHPRVADFHSTHYILPERRQNRKFFCFLLGEKPKMATNAHVSQIYTIRIITSCQRGDRIGSFSVFF